MGEIDVFLDTRTGCSRVGLLRRHPAAGRESVTFEYDPDWLRQKDAFQIGTDMPLIAGAQPAPPSGMFGVLGDSAPDTWGRTLMRRREARAAKQEGRRRATLFESDFLLGVADFTRLGALRFRSAGCEEFEAPLSSGVPRIVQLGALQAASRRILKGEETDEDLQMLFAPGSSLGGARPKVSIYDQHNVLSIAKFPKETDTYSVSRWEAIALDMARAAGINTVDFDLVQTDHGPVFVTRRLDRDGDHRIPFVSAMAMTEHRDGETGSYPEIAEAITTFGAQPTRDLHELFRRVAFTILISNTDDHLRNHGFIRPNAKGWRLSPCYDVNPVPHGGALKTAVDTGDDTTPSLELLIENAGFFGAEAEATKIIGEVANVAKDWKRFAAARHAPQGEVNQMEPAFEHGELDVGLSRAETA